MIPNGPLNLALLGVSLSVSPAVVVPASGPASVVTSPLEITILRILLLEKSATYRLVPSVAMPAGELNLALLAVALSVDPAVVIPAGGPANVVTAPLEITILRILLLLQSATYRLVPSVVIPYGLLNLALLAVALSVDPAVVIPAGGPANVVTAPLETFTLRILLLLHSAT